MDRFNTIKKLLEEYEKEMNLISLKDKCLGEIFELQSNCGDKFAQAICDLDKEGK